MKKMRKFLKSNGGYVFIIMIVIIMGMGTLGLAIAAGTVSNMRAHMGIDRLERDFYSADGSMNFILSMLERACAYARQNAKNAVQDEYDYGIENEIYYSAEYLADIYKTVFVTYLTEGNGKNYIDEELEKMKDSGFSKTNAAAMWDERTLNSDGIQLRVNIQLLQKKEKLSALFNLPFNYVTSEQTAIEIGREVPEGSMPIGYYNPLFRAPLTMKGQLTLNGGADMELNASDNGIAMQWVNGLTTDLAMINSRVDMNGTTLPLLEETGTKTFTVNGNKKFFVNGINVAHSTPCESSKRFDLQDYYNSSLLNQIVINDDDPHYSYFEATEGNCVLRVYTDSGLTLTHGQDSGQDWDALNGKRGLIVITGSLTANGNCALDNFTGSVVILGNNSTILNSGMTITHNEDAVRQAIGLYRKTTGSDTLERLFRLDELLSSTTDPVGVVRRTVSGGTLFNFPLTLGNSYVTGSGINGGSSIPYFRIADKSFYLTNDVTQRGLQSSTGEVELTTQNTINYYFNNGKVWSKDDAGTKPVYNAGNLFECIDSNLLRSWKNSNIASICREQATENGALLKVFTGDQEIRNSGELGNENINGRSGLIFINGRLSISGGFNFNGVVIATNGMNAYNGGDVKITYNMAKALDALSLSESAIDLFAPGTVIQTKTTSVYDNVPPSAPVPQEDLSLFDAAVTISNVKFDQPYTSATVYSSTSNLFLHNNSLTITANGGKGLQATTNNIFADLHNKKETITSDIINTTDSGTFVNNNKIGRIMEKINGDALAQWLGSGSSIKVQSGDLVLGLLSDGFNESDYNGKRGFLFYNGQLDIKHDFDFRGVVVATNGMSFKNGDMSFVYDRQSAIDALALSPTAASIFLNVTQPTPTEPGVVYGATNAGTLNTINKGVTIISWNSIK